MNKTEIISILKSNNFFFEDNGDQVIVKLARRFFLKLYIENNTVVKNEDMVKQFGLIDGKSLKAVIKITMIIYFLLSLPIVLLCILNPYFFSTGGKYFFIMIITIILSQLVDFWYKKNHLSKIKTLLHLND